MNLQDKKIETDFFYMRVLNHYIDEIFPKLKSSEVLILLLVLRKTIGWRKKWDRISFSQFQKLCGLASESITNGVEKLEKLGLIEVERPGSGKTNIYRLILDAKFTEKEKQIIESTSKIEVPETKSTSKIEVPETKSTSKIEVPQKSKYFENRSNNNIIIDNNSDSSKLTSCEKISAAREEASHIENKSEERKKPETSSSFDKIANSSEDSSGSRDSKPKKNKEVFDSGKAETFNSGEVDFMPNEKVFSKSFIPVDLSKEAAYMANIQKIINSGGELSGNQILSVFRKKYGDAGLGSYLILKQHRVKMKAFLVDLKTCKMLQITDYYIRNYKGIHKECNISSDKPSVDILLSSYMNHFISKALNEDVKKKEIDPNNLGIPEKFRDVVTAAGSW